VLAVHDPELHPGEDSLAHRVLDGVNRLHVDGWVLLSGVARDAFVARNHLDPARVAVVPLGMFDDLVDRTEPLAHVPALAALAPLSGRYLLAIGRIKPYKGIDELLGAYAAIPAESAPPLVVAGAGQFSAAQSVALKALADGGWPVTVINRWLTDEESASLTAAARWVVTPYTSATQSGVIPLASAFGVPVIASDAGGLAEQVEDGVSGLLVPAGDAGALRGAIERVAAMGEAEYDGFVAGCREFASREWGRDALAGRLLEFFASLKA